MYRHLETLEESDTNMKSMKSLRTSLDDLYAYEILHMPARLNERQRPDSLHLQDGEQAQIDQQDKLVNEGLYDESMECQDRVLAGIHQLFATKAQAAKDEGAEAEDGTKIEHNNEEQTVDKTTVKAHQATVEDFDGSESAEEPATVTAKSFSSNTGDVDDVQNGGGPGHTAHYDSPSFDCPECDETFEDNLDLLLHAGAHSSDVKPHVGCERCVQAGRIQTLRGHFLGASGIGRIAGLPCVTCSQHQNDVEPVVMQNVQPIRRSKTQAISRARHNIRQRDLARRGNEMSLRQEKQIHTAASANVSGTRQEQTTGREVRVREEHTRLMAESVKITQTAYNQGLQVAMQHELEALEVQEALIAARKEDLQLKMTKLEIETRELSWRVRSSDAQEAFIASQTNKMKAKMGQVETP
jgi:hypothetical protein